jgi:hypothetical protein
MLVTCRNGGVGLAIVHEKREWSGDQSWEKGTRMVKS